MPLLAFDAWEHAFYLQYKNVKADFFAALWNIINWPDVAARFDAARAVVHPASTVGAVQEIPDRWRDLGKFIREQRDLSRLSLRRLSDLAGISNPYLSQIERGLRKPSAEILQQIAKALRISAETLYERAGLLEAPRGRAATPVAAILRDPLLTEDGPPDADEGVPLAAHRPAGEPAVPVASAEPTAGTAG